MRIDVRTGNSIPGQGVQMPTNTGSTPFSDVLAMARNKAGVSGAKQLDFTGMTRQEMRDWVNDQIRSGKMSLKDSSPFMAMTLKIPVGGTTEIPAAGDHERINFMERARSGIEGALWNHDLETATRLRATMAIMLKKQGQALDVRPSA
jgi:hypothetical protein